MRAALVLVVIAGCGTSYQSARTLAPGQTQFTGALNRTTPDDDLAPDEGLYSGDLQVRRGIQPRLDGGVRYSGSGGLHAVAVDVKYEVVPKHVSIALPIAISFGEERDFGEMRDLDYGGLILAPTLFIGGEISPNTAELVGAPKLYIVIPDGGDSTSQVGLSLGLRLSTDLTRWAIHPELAYVNSDGADLVTMGVGVSATY